MTSFSQLWRTTTVRLTAIFVLIFVAFSVLLLAVISYQSSIQIQRQQAADIDREIRQITKIDDRQGFRASIIAVERLSRQPGPGIYFIGDPTGQLIVGNVSSLPPEVLTDPGSYTFNYDRPRPADPDAVDAADPPPPQGNAMVRSVLLPSGHHDMEGLVSVERNVRLVEAEAVGGIGDQEQILAIKRDAPPAGRGRRAHDIVLAGAR